MLERQYDGYTAYGQSKRALTMFTIELADRLSGSDVTVNSVHPGTNMPTKVVLSELGPASVTETLASGVEAVRRQVLDPPTPASPAPSSAAGTRARPARAHGTLARGRACGP
jgi:NAD(P)-dependent dehydrogenase (short-subunit alcohol dehydrogenase family)